MKGTPLLYAILKRELGSKYRIELVYDVRAVSLAGDGIVMVWQSGLSRDWYGIGGKYMLAREDVGVFYGSNDRSKYQQFDTDLRSVLEGKKWMYRFVADGQPVSISATSPITTVWAYLYTVQTDQQLSEGQYVQVIDPNGNTITGWVLGQVGTNQYYIFTGSAIFYLFRLTGQREESSGGRLLYRSIYTVRVEYIDSEVS